MINNLTKEKVAVGMREVPYREGSTTIGTITSAGSAAVVCLSRTAGVRMTPARYPEVHGDSAPYQDSVTYRGGNQDF